MLVHCRHLSSLLYFLPYHDLISISGSWNLQQIITSSPNTAARKIVVDATNYTNYTESAATIKITGGSMKFHTSDQGVDTQHRNAILLTPQRPCIWHRDTRVLEHPVLDAPTTSDKLSGGLPDVSAYRPSDQSTATVERSFDAKLIHHEAKRGDNSGVRSSGHRYFADLQSNTHVNLHDPTSKLAKMQARSWR